MSSVALARIGEEGDAILARAAASEPPKIVARKVGITPRHVVNLAKGDCSTGWKTMAAFAQHYPEVGDFWARLLRLNPPIVAGADQVLAEIRSLVARHPEEGDREPQ